MSPPASSSSTAAACCPIRATSAPYQTRKSERLESRGGGGGQVRQVLAQEEVWIRQGVKARRVRDEGQVRRLEALRLQRAARRDQQGQVRLEVSAGERSGKIVADLENVQALRH
ncbi:hypothetical protein [Duganella sp. BJB1802]|uniref:hypothetical protein n=1 Tax=Duganella sp. BJB1802 TaxID=2744575 RepID=UPI001E40E670|nr:hypothetical protein [Duganella sp. BJB1802]